VNADRRARKNDLDRHPVTEAERRLVLIALKEFDAHWAEETHMTIAQFSAMLRDMRDTVVPWVNERAQQERQWGEIKLHVQKTIAAGATWSAIVAMMALAVLGAPAFATWLLGRFS
jgi:hypothetical protein